MKKRAAISHGKYVLEHFGLLNEGENVWRHNINNWAEREAGRYYFDNILEDINVPTMYAYVCKRHSSVRIIDCGTFRNDINLLQSLSAQACNT
mmetsp:Transcript_20669/g.48549  ORF Transcript_20669/g.48549 Transcript_20669/m.48549 type:complete len:93 (-) Transcript_20669:173-451(-)